MATKESAPKEATAPASTDDKAAADAVAVRVAAEAAAAECAATQHLWALPEKNPFNSSTLECSFACKRCGAPASFTIAVGKK